MAGITAATYGTRVAGLVAMGPGPVTPEEAGYCRLAVELTWGAVAEMLYALAGLYDGQASVDPMHVPCASGINLCASAAALMDLVVQRRVPRGLVYFAICSHAAVQSATRIFPDMVAAARQPLAVQQQQLQQAQKQQQQQAQQAQLQQQALQRAMLHQQEVQVARQREEAQAYADLEAQRRQRAFDAQRQQETAAAVHDDAGESATLRAWRKLKEAAEADAAAKKAKDEAEAKAKAEAAAKEAAKAAELAALDAWRKQNDPSYMETAAAAAAASSSDSSDDSSDDSTDDNDTFVRGSCFKCDDFAVMAGGDCGHVTLCVAHYTDAKVCPVRGCNFTLEDWRILIFPTSRSVRSVPRN